MSKPKGKWTPPEKTDPCPYHPDVQMVWRQKRIGNDNGRSPKARRPKLWWFQCCDECEWNPPDFGSGYSDVGRTAPNIKNLPGDDFD